MLYCLKKLNGERTIYSIYHLLKGKKTSQTIQDAHLFNLTSYFGIYPAITREYIEKAIHHLAGNEWIESCLEQRYCLTKLGEGQLFQLQRQNPAPVYLNGLKYHQIDRKLWERLSLLVQVVSNLINKETNYIPIQKDKETHDWLKTFLSKTKFQRNMLAKTFYTELVDCMESEQHINPSVFVFRLTGFQCIGQTSQQTAEMLNMDYEQYYLEFLNILHFLIEKITTYKNRFPLLHSILENSVPDTLMTNSSSKTYELLKMGYSIKQIAEFRRLKKSTIEDHIVEIAINIADFSIDDFVEPKQQSNILKVAEQTSSKQLKLIRNAVSSANYFEIRLVLAKHGVK
jgi:uncharacterized protein YpbB